jgi:hypothetical protein
VGDHLDITGPRTLPEAIMCGSCRRQVRLHAVGTAPGRSEFPDRDRPAVRAELAEGTPARRGHGSGAFPECRVLS